MRTLLLSALLCAAALAQPGMWRTPPYALYLIQYLGNDSLHKELRLDAEQKRRAANLAAGANARSLAVMTGKMTATDLRNEVEKDLAFLSAAQRQRLGEVVLRQMDNFGAGKHVVAEDNNLAADLGLTPAQRARVAKEAFADVLDADQKKKFEKMRGAPFAGVLAPAGSAVTNTPPPLLQYLSAAPVVAELKLTEKQRARIAEIAERWPRVPTKKTSIPENVHANLVTLAAELENEARALLDRKQAARLTQILLHAERSGLRRERDVYTLPGVAAHLKIRPEQSRKMADLVARRQAGVTLLLATDDEPRAVMESLWAYHNETMRQLTCILGETQRDALPGLFGDPPAGEVEIKEHLPPSRGPVTFGRQQTYLYLTALKFATVPALHKELGLTDGQADRLSEMIRKTTTGRREDAGQDAAARARLATFLTPEQVKRLGQVTFQQYGKPGAAISFSIGSLLRVSEFREGVGLTPAQRKKADAPFGRLKLADFLTPAQMERWKAMCGPPTELLLSSADINRFARIDHPEIVFLERSEVRADLKLSIAQQDELAAIGKAYRKKAEALADGRPADTSKARAAAREEASAAVAKVLDAAQTARLAELGLRRLRVKGVSELLTSAAVEAAVNLSAEQRRRLADLHAWRERLTAALRQEAGLSHDDTLPPAEEAAESAIRRNVDRRMEALLDAGQKKKLDALLGRPFKGSLPR